VLIPDIALVTGTIVNDPLLPPLNDTLLPPETDSHALELDTYADHVPAPLPSVKLIVCEPGWLPPLTYCHTNPADPGTAIVPVLLVNDVTGLNVTAANRPHAFCP
jgi:hypothetical protein